MFLMSPRRSARTGVVVLRGKKALCSLSQRKRGPKWIPLSPKRQHVLRVFTDGDSFHDLTVLLDEGEQRVLYVEPLNNGKDIVRLLRSAAFDK